MRISLVNFLWIYFRSASIHDLMRTLNEVYGNGQAVDYEVSYGIGTLYVKQTHEGVQHVLDSDYRLGYFNRIFNQAHGLSYTINNFDTDHEIWHDIHRSVKVGLDRMFNGNFQNLMKKPKRLL